MHWIATNQKEKQQAIVLFNFTSKSAPSIREYVDTICAVLEMKRSVPNVPYSLLLVASYCIDVFLKPLSIKHPFSPVRIKKSRVSNHIVPTIPY